MQIPMQPTIVHRSSCHRASKAQAVREQAITLMNAAVGASALGQFVLESFYDFEGACLLSNSVWTTEQQADAETCLSQCQVLCPNVGIGRHCTTCCGLPPLSTEQGSTLSSRSGSRPPRRSRASTCSASSRTGTPSRRPRPWSEQARARHHDGLWTKAGDPPKRSCIHRRFGVF